MRAGFEYYGDPDSPADSFVKWVSDGEQSYSLVGTAVGPDADTGVGQRLVPMEPMVRAPSLNWIHC